MLVNQGFTALCSMWSCQKPADHPNPDFSAWVYVSVSPQTKAHTVSQRLGSWRGEQQKDRRPSHRSPFFAESLFAWNSDRSPLGFWKGGTAKDPPSVCVLGEITLSSATLKLGLSFWNLWGWHKASSGNGREWSWVYKEPQGAKSLSVLFTWALWDLECLAPLCTCPLISRAQHTLHLTYVRAARFWTIYRNQVNKLVVYNCWLVLANSSTCCSWKHVPGKASLPPMCNLFTQSMPSSGWKLIRWTIPLYSENG